MSDTKIIKSAKEWKAQLTDEQYKVAREGGTERAFTGALYDNKEDGEYQCICCGEPLFSSDEKYDSGSGWPSFWKPMQDHDVAEVSRKFHFHVQDTADHKFVQDKGTDQAELNTH